ncbi:MAG: dihydrodipicolinate synthase family protein [Pseudomonadota bacterium]
MGVFEGLSAFPVTPADAEGRVDTDHLQRLVARLVRDGIASIGALGSTGSYMYLSGSERQRALHAAVEAAGTTPVIAGIGAMRTAEVIAHARAAEAAGASGLLLAPVRYLPLNDDEILGLFSDVAAATALPILIYNNPGTTGLTISEDLTARLAAIPGVAAVKNPPAPEGDFAGQIARLRRATPDGFVLGYSGDSRIAGALAAGAEAWYSVIAGTLPGPAAALWAARGDAGALAAQAASLAPLLALFDQYGGIRIVHAMAEMLGLGAVTPPPPLRPLGAEAVSAIEAALDTVLHAGAAA